MNRCIASLALALLAGCATRPPLPPETTPVGPGKVAVVVAHDAPRPAYNDYAQGRIGNAGWKGARYAVFGAAVATGPWLILAGAAPKAGIALAPYVLPPLLVVGAVVGGTAGVVSGAVSGMPVEEASTLHAAVDRALAASDVQQAMAARFLAQVNAKPGVRFERVQAEPSDYGSLRPMGFDTVLELRVTEIGFAGYKSEPPQASFAMALRVRKVRLGWAESGAKPRRLVHEGAMRPVSDWAADDGRLMNEELEAAYADLAEQAQRSFQ